MRKRFSRLRADTFVQSFFKAAGMSMMLRVSWAVLNYAGVVLLARWLAPDDYGIYAFIMSGVMFLSVICGMGAQATLARFVGQYIGQEKPGLGRGAIQFFTWRVLMFSCSVAALLIVIAVGAQSAGWIEDARPFAVGALILPAFTVIDAQLGTARAFGSVFFALAPKDVLWRGALIPLALGVTMFVVPSHQLVTLLGGSALLITLAALGQRAALKRLTPDDFRTAEPEFDRSEWKSVTGPIWFTAVTANMLNTVDVITLGFFLPEEQVGWYFAASRTAKLVSFLLTVTTIVVAPQIARHFYAGEMGKLRRLLKLAALAIFGPTFVAFWFCVLFSDQILGLFGPAFLAVRPELLILAGGQAVNAAMGCVTAVSNMTGHQKQAAMIQIPVTFAASFLMIFAAWLYGSIGVAWVTSGAIVVMNIAMWIYVRRNTGLDPSIVGLVLPPKARS